MRTSTNRHESSLGMLAVALVAMAAGLLLVKSPAMPQGKLRVLIVEESAQRGSLPASQAEVLTAKKIRDYAASHCVMEDGQPAFRVLDLSEPGSMDKLPPAWRTIADRKHQSLPWITVAVGAKFYDGPLPKDVDATEGLLQKYGGP